MGRRSGSQDYKPVSLRWPLLVPLIVYVVALIAVVEVAGRTFPSSDDIPDNSGETGPFVTALFTAPLVNARAPLPTAVSQPVKRESILRPPRQQLRRAENGTEDASDTPTPTPQPGSVATWTYISPQASTSGSPRLGSSPFENMNTNGNANVPDPALVGSANLTEIQQAHIDSAEPIVFARHLGLPAASFLNDSQSANQPNQTWSPSRFRTRHHDPSAYAQYSGPTQIIQPLINIFFDANDVPYEGASWVNYVGGDPNNPDTFDACWATCNGPAIVFHHRACWEEWVWYGALEQEARNHNPSLAWKAIDDAYLGGVVCAESPGLKKTTSPPPGDDSDTDGDFDDTPLPVAQTLTLRDANGSPTLTVTRIEATAGPVFTTLTLRDTAGVPTATITAALTDKPTTLTLTDSTGRPTATITTTPPSKPTLLTLTDSRGAPTATITLAPSVHTLRDSRGVPTATLTLAPLLAPGKATTLTLTNSLGVPTRTLTFTPSGTSRSRGPPTTPPRQPGSQPSSQLHLITPLEYTLASFLPVLLVTPLCIFAQTINSAIRTYLPFHTMMTDGGVPAHHSLTLPLDGLAGVLTGFNMLVHYADPVATLSDVLTLLSAVAAALSSEAIGVQLYGKECGRDSFRGCFMGIAVFKGANRALEGVLIAVLVVGVGLAGVLGRWRTGVKRERGGEAKGVRSLVATGLLLGHAGTGVVLRGGVGGCGNGKIGKGKLEKAEMERKLRGWRFGLGWYLGKGEEEEYGIIAMRDRGYNPDSSSDEEKSDARGRDWWSWLDIPLLRQPTTSWASLGGFGLLCGVLGLILYYETTQLHTPFEDFMLGQNFGARVLFTALGVVISLFWDGYYARLSMMEVYRQLSRGTKSASEAALISPPVVAYSGIIDAFRRREWFVTVVAANTILANFSPILLSTIPFSPSQTWMTHLVCAWMTVAFLVVMILTLLYGAVFIGHPRMVVDPGTLAGRIYYVYDLGLLSDFHGAPEEKRGAGVMGEGVKVYRPSKTTGVLDGNEKGAYWEHAKPHEDLKTRQTKSNGKGWIV